MPFWWETPEDMAKLPKPVPHDAVLQRSARGASVAAR
jgi:hypothetical protein